jgi:TIR domain/Trypsin-like peptidase domain
VIDGRWVGEKYAGLPLFFTARHVIPGDFLSLPKGIAIKFDALTDDVRGGTATVERLLAVSPLQDLNYSVALLDRWPGRVSPLHLCPQDPVPGDLIFVLGFPGGRGLEVSLDDNEVLAPPPTHTRPGLLNPTDVILYSAPTEGGSSGSPVFNENWELVGIHMGSDRTAQVNYGARIHQVLADARRTLENLVLEDEVVARVTSPVNAATRPDYLSVFISYSRVDSVFADRLFNSLRSAGIRVWYDKQNIFPGYDIYDEISKGIQEQDKILFCFSDASIKSGWVDAEIDRALQKEHALFKTVASSATVRRSRSKTLIPLDLDGRLIEGRWESGKAADMMSRGIADFRNWQNQSAFDQTFAQLLPSLVAEVPKPKF